MSINHFDIKQLPANLRHWPHREAGHHRDLSHRPREDLCGAVCACVFRSCFSFRGPCAVELQGSYKYIITLSTVRCIGLTFGAVERVVCFSGFIEVYQVCSPPNMNTAQALAASRPSRSWRAV